MNSVRDKTPNEPLIYRLSERWKIQIVPSPKVLLSTVQTPQSSRNQTVTHTIQDHACLTSRRASSPCKKGIFYNLIIPLQKRSYDFSLQNTTIIPTHTRQSNKQNPTTATSNKLSFHYLHRSQSPNLLTTDKLTQDTEHDCKTIQDRYYNKMCDRIA